MVTMNVKKVAFLRTSWPGGGLENVVTSVANIMKEDMGMEPILILNEEPRGKVPSCEILNLGIGKVGDFPLKGHPINMINYINQLVSYFFVLRREVSGRDLDLVLALDPETVTMLKHLFKDIPVVVWIHESLKAFWSKSGMWPVIGRGFVLADAIIVINKSMKNEISDLCPSVMDKTFVIYNPITTEPISGVYQPGTRKIVYIGRLSNRDKRLDRLLKAFKMLLADHKSWKLTIIGDCPDREMVEALIAELGLDNHVELADTKILGNIWQTVAVRHF